MTGIVKNVGEFFSVLVQAFNLSAIFPALILVLFTQAHVLSLLPEGAPWRSALNLNRPSVIASTALAVALIAYLLDAANLKIIRLFEGYSLSRFPLFSWVQERDRAFVAVTMRRIRRIQLLADWLLDKAHRTQSPARKKELRNLYAELVEREDELLSQIEDKYPEDPSLVLPTPFGNVIAAAEYYTHKVFGMDAVALWPFLVPTLTERDYAQHILRAKAMMDFVLNLTAVMGALGVFVGITEYYVAGWSTSLAVKLMLIAGSCSATFVLAVQGAASWGTTFKAAFVLFREDLRLTLRLRRARDYTDERELWENVSSFLGAQDLPTEHARLGHSIFNAPSYKSPLFRKEAKS